MLSLSFYKHLNEWSSFMLSHGCAIFFPYFTNDLIVIFKVWDICYVSRISRLTLIALCHHGAVWVAIHSNQLWGLPGTAMQSLCNTYYTCNPFNKLHDF